MMHENNIHIAVTLTMNNQNSMTLNFQTYTRNVQPNSHSRLQISNKEDYRWSKPQFCS